MDEVGLSADDLVALGEFMEFLGDASSPARQQIGRFLRDYSQEPGEGQVPGVPIRVVELSARGAGDITEIIAVERRGGSSDRDSQRAA